MDQDNLHQVEQILDHTFANGALLTRAFTHSSAVDNRLDSNERLEFLGDAVLSLVITEKLYRDYSQLSEGEMTKLGLPPRRVRREAYGEVREVAAYPDSVSYTHLTLPTN